MGMNSNLNAHEWNGEQNEGGLVDLTLIELKLAVVWTAKRMFYS